MTLPEHSESTPDQPANTVAARHGTRTDPEPASTESDTPEGRLLARKGSPQYLEDVRTLIAERDTLRATVDAFVSERAKWERARARPTHSEREFGKIRTVVDE